MENIYSYRPEAEERNAALAFPSLISKVYLWMTMALAITGLSAYYVASNEGLIYSIVTNQALYWGLIIGELALVWILSASINRLSFPVAGLMFAVYSILNGVVLSYIFLVYTLESITATFFATAGTFGAMSLVGFFIKKDLGRFGRFFLMALIGLIVASIVNIFVASSALGVALTYIGVLLFCGLTAYDTQKMKVILAQSGQVGETGMMKIALMCALSLYLDFINLFLYLLRILGSRK